MAVVTDIFPNFASALAACGQGYNDGEIADVVAFMTTAMPIDNLQVAPEQAVNSILAVGITAAEITDRPLHVLDFGGGCGFHRLRVGAAIHAPLRWAVVETPAMAERAAKLAQGRFEVFTDIAAAAAWLGRIDLVHASSSIQYVPDPLAVLKTVAGLRALLSVGAASVPGAARKSSAFKRRDWRLTAMARCRRISPTARSNIPSPS
jgi:putative methyltransferase (TIGR04325 family)